MTSLPTPYPEEFGRTADYEAARQAWLDDPEPPAGMPAEVVELIRSRRVDIAYRRQVARTVRAVVTAVGLLVIVVLIAIGLTALSH